MKREEYCIAQSVIAAIRNISSMYESDGVEQEIHGSETRDRIFSLIEKHTTIWQRQNAAEFLTSIVEDDETDQGE